MSKGNATENSILRLMYQGIDWSGVADDAASGAATSVVVALHKSDPGEAGTQGTNEANYPGYARVRVARTNAAWTVTANSVSPAAAILFPQCTGGTDIVSHWSTGQSDTIWHSGTIQIAGSDATIAISTGITPILASTSAITED